MPSPAQLSPEPFRARPLPPRVQLMPGGAIAPPGLAPVLEAWGYALIPEAPALSPPTPAPLVNTAIAICPGTGEGLAAAIAQLGQRPTYQEALLADFEAVSPAIAALWGSLNDGVMGGVSTSQVQWQNGLRFTGQVSTANNGGFASVRTRNLEPPLALGQWQGTVLYLRGDGQRYKWILRDSPGWDSLAYCRSFDTAIAYADTTAPVTVRTLFRDMVPTRRARAVPGAPPLNPTQIYAMQLMLSKFEYNGALNPAFHTGAFGLTVQRLGVFRQGPKPVVLLPRQTAEVDGQLAAAGLSGVMPQGQSFRVVGASDRLPPQVNPGAVRAIFAALD